MLMKIDSMAWISVEDELPTGSGDYLTYGSWWDPKERGDIGICYFSKERARFGWNEDEGCIRGPEHITHWMHLPEVPGEG